MQTDRDRERKRRYDQSEKGKVRAQRYREQNAESLRLRKSLAYLGNIDTERKRRRLHYQENADVLNERCRQYKAQNQDKVEAQQAVRIEVRKGNMPKASECVCKACGSQASQYHHSSYESEDWLNVVPLCNSCHVRVHRGTLVL